MMKILSSVRIFIVLGMGAGLGLTGCAGTHESDAPTIDTYLNRVMNPTARYASTTQGRVAEMDPQVPFLSGQPLALQRCVTIALENNPRRRVAEAGLEAMQEAVGEAWSPYYPEVNLNAGYHRWERHAFLPDDVASAGNIQADKIGPTSDWSAGLGARFTLFDSGARRARLNEAVAREGVAEGERETVRQGIILDVHQAYYALVSAMEAHSVAAENLKRSENHLHLAKIRKETGAVPQADVVRAMAEVADTRLQLIRAESWVRIARGNLNTAMGLPVETLLELDPQPGVITSPQGINLSQALDHAVHTRPELETEIKRIEASRSSMDATKSAFGPRVKLEGGYGWRDDEFLPQDEDWSVGFSLELPLFSGFSTKHELARKRAEHTKEEALLEQLILKVRQEVWFYFSELTKAYESVNASDVFVLDARESLRLVRERYEAGAAPINDLLDSQAALARAESEQIKARWDYHDAMALYRRSIGDMDSGEWSIR